METVKQSRIFFFSITDFKKSGDPASPCLPSLLCLTVFHVK